MMWIYSDENSDVGGDWNMTGLVSHINWEESSSQLTFIFFRGVETTNQMGFPMGINGMGHNKNSKWLQDFATIYGMFVNEIR